MKSLKKAVLITLASISFLYAQHGFVKNNSQFDKDVLYASKIYSGGFFALKNAQIYTLSNANTKRSVIFKQDFIGSNVSKIVPSKQLPTIVRYLKRDLELKSYADLIYKNLYKKIDLKVSWHKQNTENIFILKKGSKLSDIKIKTNHKLKLSKDGDLIAKTNMGDIRFSAPIAWQGVKKKHPIKVRYALTKDGYGFVAQKYNKSKTLFIDPLLASTFIGGGSNDFILDLKQNKTTKEIYAVGSTDSFTNMQINALQSYRGNQDGFVIRFNEDLNKTISYTYIGGSKDDQALSVDIDETSNDVFVAGFTSSSDFGSGHHGKKDGFVSRFNQALVHQNTKLLGGSEDDVFSSISVNGVGVFVAGYSSSNDLALANGHTTSPSGNYDGIIVRFSKDLNTQPNASFVGGNQKDEIIKIKVNDKNLTVVGTTMGGNFVLDNGTFGGGQDIFVGEYSLNLSDKNITSFGGSGDDEVQDLDLNSTHIALGGVTSGTLMGAVNAQNAQKSGFVAISPMGMNSPSFISMYVGGSKDDYVSAVKFDDDNHTLFVAGYTDSSDLVTTTNAFSGYNAFDDGFIARIDGTTTQVLTYFGGSAQDVINAMDVGSRVIVAGATDSSDLNMSSITGNLRSLEGAKDGFVASFDKDLSRNMPILGVNTSYVNFANVKLQEPSSIKTISLSNIGTSTLVVQAIELNTTSEGFSIHSSSSCPTTSFNLDAKKTCTINMQFIPPKLNEANASIIIKHSGSVEDNVSLSGIGVLDGVQKIALSHDIVSSVVAVNASKTYNLTIKNIGNAPLVISSITSNDGNFTIEKLTSSNACPNLQPTISPAFECVVGIKFSPTQKGDYNTSVSVNSNDPANAQKSIPINAQSSTGLIASTSDLDFGDKPIAAPQNTKKITLTNTSATNVTISNVVSSDPIFSIISNTCITTLAPSATCDIDVDFIPTSTTTTNASLNITSDDASNPNIAINLHGKGIPASTPNANINPQAINFDVVAIGASKPSNAITITNSGTATLNITNLSTTNPAFTIESNSTCTNTTSLAYNTSCQIWLRFTPTVKQDYDGNLTIKTNAKEHNVSLFGRGNLNTTSALSLKAFRVLPSAGVAPLNVQFFIEANGGSGGYTYAWDFNDSHTSSLQNPQNRFTKNGDHNVSVKVSDAANPLNFFIIDTNVSVGNYAPLGISSLNVSPSSGEAPLQTSFNVVPSGGSSQYTYLWDFNDSHTSSVQNPTHTFEAGSYDVNLTIKDKLDPSKTISTIIKVLSFDANVPNISLNTTPTNGQAPLNVTVKAGATKAKLPLKITWDFGDGNTQDETINSLEFSTTHTYKKAGNYALVLKIEDANGVTSRAVSRVNVAQNIVVNEIEKVKSSTKNGDYCFVATASYGENSNQVRILRKFRDAYLLTNPLGKDFVRLYYAYSPPIANFISKSDTLKFITRAVLSPLVLSVEYPAQTLVISILMLILFNLRPNRIRGARI